MTFNCNIRIVSTFPGNVVHLVLQTDLLILWGFTYNSSTCTKQSICSCTLNVVLQLCSSCKMTMTLNNRSFVWTKFQMCSDNNIINSDYFVCLRKDAHERSISHIKLLRTKCRLLYLNTQSVPRCKHFSTRL